MLIPIPKAAGKNFLMSIHDTKDLKKFLKPFSKDVQKLALELREWVWEMYPDCNELIYDNYNALAFGWSPTDGAGDVFCSIAVYGRLNQPRSSMNSSLNFGFNRGSEINDPKNLLNGNGSLYRFIRVTDLNDFPKTYLKKLVKQAYVNSKARIKERAKRNKGRKIMKGLTIVKMISEKKR